MSSPSAPELHVHLALPRGHRTLELELRTSATVLAIEGPSGAGKSSLLRAIAGVDRRFHGRIIVDNQIWEDAGVTIPPWKRNLAWLPQDALLFPHLTVERNLLSSSGGSRKWIAQELGIDHLLTRHPRHLSGGERQRVALARVLLAEKDLLLLDEPFAALDPELRRIARNLTRVQTARTGQRVILVSHDPDDARDWAEETWLLAGGRLTRKS